VSGSGLVGGAGNPHGGRQPNSQCFGDGGPSSSPGLSWLSHPALTSAVFGLVFGFVLFVVGEALAGGLLNAVLAAIVGGNGVRDARE
jgi:hypothetical protein